MICFDGCFFHNYKRLLQIIKKYATIDEDYLKEEMTSLLETKPEGKVLFYRFSKKWYGFLYSVHKDDM
jgi:hypothetical protein